ncbi:hypothetical protein PybrP1_006661 [[Pythium] brassicae (nom. inval.)]|nr:hypothetical protein PybrP1_006661 [[Pythium] brassicae (nom. inval.)]
MLGNSARPRSAPAGGRSLREMAAAAAQPQPAAKNRKSSAGAANSAKAKRKSGKSANKSNNNNNNNNNPGISSRSSSAAAEAEATAADAQHGIAWQPRVAFVNDPALPLEERLGNEMASYCAYTSATVAGLQKAIDAAVAHIAACVVALWPEASVACFGSFASGLWLPSSDVDVVVLGLSSEHDPDVKTRFVVGKKELQQLAARLRTQQWVQRIDVVSSAKVPVAKLVLAERGLRVDISVENVHTRSGIDASELVRAAVAAEPALHALVVVVRQLLREKGLNDAFTGGLSSYAVALLAMYLVARQELPAPAGDRDSARDSDAARGRLLLAFLEFYGLTFDYATTGISLQPEAFGEYFLAPHVLRSNGVALVPQLVLDDPVAPGGQHNAAAGAFAIARVIAAFEDAFYAISFHRASRFAPTPLCQVLHRSGHASPPTPTAG